MDKLEDGRSFEETQIVVHRGNVVKSVELAMRKPSFSFNNQLTVTFSGEEAEDQGGPRREFLRYVFIYAPVNQVAACCLFLRLA